MIERFSGILVAPTTPIVGANAFSHESGIHSHGIIKESKTFEPGIMTPEMVGHMRRLVLGKHTGKHAMKKLLNDAGLDPQDVQLNEMLERIKDLGDKGRKVTDVDLYAIAEVVMGDVAAAEKHVVLEELSIMTGNRVAPTATVWVTVDGKTYTGARTGGAGRRRAASGGKPRGRRRPQHAAAGLRHGSHHRRLGSTGRGHGGRGGRQGTHGNRPGCMGRHRAGICGSAGQRHEPPGRHAPGAPALNHDG
jgi:hypothetical protein